LSAVIIIGEMRTVGVRFLIGSPMVQAPRMTSGIGNPRGIS